MQKLALGLAALAAIAIAIPCAALADTVVIHKHRPIYNEVVPPPYHHYHSNKTVIIKHHDNY